MRKLCFLLMACLLTLSLLAQTTEGLSGVVVDQQGSPVAGATIRIPSLNKAIRSEDAGNFILTHVPAGSFEVIATSVGYDTARQNIVYDGKSSQLLFTLQASTNNLNDIVVVGYGTQRKEDLTAAISVVDAKMLKDRPVTNTFAALQGTAPGLVITRSSGQPGKESYAAQIRGTSSVNGSSVLILVDGVEQTSLTSIDPNDIASVSVLKDAAAAAIYGSRAAGGVILVTTKSGRVGKIRVNYSGLYTVNKPYNRPERIHSWQEAEMQNEATVNAGQRATYTDEQINLLKNPDTNYIINPATGNYDWYYDFNQIPYLMRKTTMQQNHNLSLSGGNAKTQYLFSLGYVGQNGVFKVGPDDYKRYNARFNFTTQFTGWLSLDARVAYYQTKTLSPAMDVGGGSGILYNLYSIRTRYPVYIPGSDDTKYASGGSLAYPNLKDGGKTVERHDGINGVFTLKAHDFIKGLELKAIYAPYLDNYNFNRSIRTVPMWDAKGPVSPLNPTNSYAVNKQDVYRNNVQFLADYDLALGEGHHFHLLGGYQFENLRSETISATAKNLSSNDLFSLNLGDPTQYSASDDIFTWATQSVFSRFNYNYKQRYFLEATIRSDGSSRLAPGYRYQSFPSVSAGWQLAQEPWFKKALPVFNQFKIRASDGRLGNSDLSNFGYYDYIALISKTTSPYPFNNQKNYGYYNATLASPEKTWEKIDTKDIGLDLGLFKDRLTLSADLYEKKNVNMLVQVNTTAMLGIGTSQYNYATLKTNGWEFNFGWKDNVGENFSYWINGNIADSKNEVTQYQGKSIIAEGVNSVVQGLPINTIWGYKATGLFSSQEEVDKYAFISNTTGPGDIRYEDVNGDGKINAGRGTLDDHGDLVNLGSTSPRYTFGFDLGFRYKGFDFDAFFQGVGKRAMVVNSAFVLPFVSSWRMPNQDQLDYWTPDHMDARYPRLYMGGSSNTLTSSWWVQNTAYLRLKNLQVGYTLPEKMTNKAGISAARIFFSGQDLWETTGMWINYYNPENPTNASTTYPFFRSFAVGLNLTFN